MAEIYFVRTETLPELPPPVAERGMVKWLRENLFSSVISVSDHCRALGRL